MLFGLFEFVYYQHAIHSVKLTKIVGVESRRCNLVLSPPPPQPKITYTYAPEPAVIGVGQNAPVLQLQSEVHMRPCHTMAKCP